ncbi:MAG: hypothetical protein QW794_09175 [Thermosphaera sp.]
MTKFVLKPETHPLTIVSINVFERVDEPKVTIVLVFTVFTKLTAYT